MILSMRDRLTRGDVILLDGAIGTRLQALGLGGGEIPEQWNLSRPEDVASVAAAYTAAGSDVVHTNSFGASPLKLAAHGLSDQAEEINIAAANAARKGADGRALVSGSMGPCGGLLQPYGDLDPAEVAAGLALQAKALVAGGVDLLCVETMIDLAEAVLAVTAARAALPDGVVMVSLTFEPTPGGWFTIMGNDVPTAAAELCRAGADVIGSNCGQGSEGMLEIAQAFAAATSCPILIQPNAGLPVLKGTDVFYPESPADMAQALPALLAAGVRVIGGCCGTTPAHIGRLRQAIDKRAEGL
jgi:5-methyltetrahydrofolate--homocysteine methyltransferase